MSAPLRVAVVFGTRPEAVKVLPVIHALGSDDRFALRTMITGQHREMVDEILAPFAIRPDVDLHVMRAGQTLNEIVARVIPALDQIYEKEPPEMVLVQGDTTSAFAAALAAFHRRIPVAHIEAGLRSFDRLHPFPEESNRRMVSALADLHLPPTEAAAANLTREGFARETIVITGNTVLDALLMVLAHKKITPSAITSANERRLVLITLHRRESWDAPGELPIVDVLEGIRAVADSHPEVDFRYPVHRNPRVREPVQRILGDLENVQLVEPIPYLPFVELMARATVIVTDSGGIQEEAPSLGVPVLVLRRTTERPEGIAWGGNRLVGTSSIAVQAELARVLDAPPAPRPELPCPSPFGDGKAALRTRDAILHFFDRAERPIEFSPADLASATPAQKGARS